MFTVTQSTQVPATNAQLIAKLQQQAQAAVQARQQALQAAASVLMPAQPATPSPAHQSAHQQAALAQSQPTNKRTRIGTNQSYTAVTGNLRPSALAQLMGYWGYTKEQAVAVCLGYWGQAVPNVKALQSTAETKWRDGTTKGYKKDGVTPYKDYQVPAILKALGENVRAVRAAIENALTPSAN